MEQMERGTRFKFEKSLWPLPKQKKFEENAQRYSGHTFTNNKSYLEKFYIS